MFDKDNNKVVVVHCGNVPHCPPVINVCECLVNNGIKTHLIGGDVSVLPPILLNNCLFTYSDLGNFKADTLAKKVKIRKRTYQGMRDEFSSVMRQGDIVWTTTEGAVKYLNKLLVPYQNKHVMQLMELLEFCPVAMQLPIIKFPIDKYARNAWKTVVPEINRAYIQQILWKQTKTPYVLPNKSYYLEPGEITPEVNDAINIMRQEKRKIILYMGIFSPDRDMESFIKAVDILKEDYCLMAIGRISDVMKDKADYIINRNNNFHYLGFFNPPNHLHFLQYAHIGLTPYKPTYDIKYASPLNSLYCAPNKIFEYAGFGVPMIGTNVLGLKTPFEQYGIGVCCDNLNETSIVNAIKNIEARYEEMSENCKKFYQSVDLDEIINHIIYD